MGTGIYVTRKGVTTELTRKQVKQTIMKAYGFTTTEEYNKFYDIMRNKQRAVEAYSGGKKQSVVEILYKSAKAKQRYGADYKPTAQMQRLQEAQSISSGKALQQAMKSERWLQKQAQKYTMQTYNQFKGLLDKNEKAREIFDTIKDPVKREKALSAYANKLHAEMDAQQRATGKQAVPERADVVGSTDALDFDYSDYM